MEEETKHIFTWTIENFSACTQKNEECLLSPVFTAESLVETTWCIELYPKGYEETTKDFISCYLKRLEDCTGPDVVECDHIIEAFDGNSKSLTRFQYVHRFKKGISRGWENFLEREAIKNTNSCFSLDTLTIRATLKKSLPNIFSQNSCRTKIATDHFSFVWNVKNSSVKNIKTVPFFEHLQFEITIKILEDDIKISIRRTKGFTNSQELFCRVTLIDLKGKETDSKEAILEADHPDENDTWKFPTFLKKSKITAEKDLKKNYFTLKFDFVLSIGGTLESVKDIKCRSHDFSLTTKEDFSASLKTDLKHMLTNCVHTDVVLHADEEVFRAHKCILCARSPVFSAMFNQDMIEKQSGAINISDVEAATLKSLLEFMYTGDTEIVNHESALKLLLASDRYQVLSLKEKCSSTLESLLSYENVCDVLYTADLVQQESLKVCAVNHIKENPKKIFNSDEWKKLADKNLKLATETFCKVSTY